MKLRQFLVFAALLCVSAFLAKAASSELLTRALIPAADHPVEAVLAGMSSDGRWVAFLSKADGLVTNRHNANVWDVFVKDRQTDLVQLVSVNTTGTNGANANCDEVSISRDGRWVTFTSTASDLVLNDTNAQRDIFARDMVAGTTFLVSGNPDGSVADGSASDPWLTPDGHFAVFLSTASTLTGLSDTNSLADVFIRDLVQQTTAEVTADFFGTSMAYNRIGVATPRIVGVSDSGQKVAFISGSPRLNYDLKQVTSIFNRLYVRDMAAQSNIFVSTFPGGVTNFGVSQATFSADGSSLGFSVEFPYSGLNGVGLRNLAEPESIKLLLPGQSFIALTDFQMSSDGEWFSLLFKDKTGLWLYRRADQSSAFLSNNLAVGQIVNHKWQGHTLFRSRATLSSAATNLAVGSGEVRVRDFKSPGQVAFNEDGSVAVYDTSPRGNVEIRVSDAEGDRPLLARQPVMNNSGADASLMATPLSVSADGRFVLFTSLASNLTDNNPNGWPEIYVHDRQTHTNILITVGVGGLAAAGPHYDARFSSNGQKVLFISSATNLVENDTNGWADVFVRDISNRTTRRLTGKAAVALPLAASFGSPRWAPVLSPDGRYAAFTSAIHDTLEGDILKPPVIFVVDLQTDQIWRAATNASSSAYEFIPLSVAPGPVLNYAAVTGFSSTFARTIFQTDLSQGTTELLFATKSEPMASANGKTVAGRGFVTNDLVTIPASLWKMRDGSTGYVATSIASGFDKSGQRLALSQEGRWLAFTTTNALVPEDLNTNLDVYLKDLTTTNAPVWVSQTDDGMNLVGDAAWPVVSEDGSWVAFRQSSHSTGQLDLYLRDVSESKLLNISRQTLANHPFLGGLVPVISADGRVIVAGDFLPSDPNEATPLNLFAFPIETVAIGLDSDGDGLPDDWELAQFKSLSENAESDSDGDGASNFIEWKTGTDPNDPNSRFSLVWTKSVNPESLRLGWKVPLGQNWELERSLTLSPALWEAVTEGVVQGPDPTDRHFESSLNNGNSFFRLVVKP